MYYFGYDPQTAKGKFCDVCRREHFNDGDLCTRCRERMEDEKENDYE